MATLKIEPIVTASRGEARIVITGVDPTDHDCIIGQYWIGGDGPHAGRWNLSGVLRDGNDRYALKMQDDEIIELVKLAKQLGAK